MSNAQKFCLVRDKTIGGTRVVEVARLGKILQSDPDYPRYNVYFVDSSDGRHAYERTVRPADIFDTVAKARDVKIAILSQYAADSYHANTITAGPGLVCANTLNIGLKGIDAIDDFNASQPD
jgi:hypothetical protein